MTRLWLPTVLVLVAVAAAHPFKLGKDKLTNQSDTLWDLVITYLPDHEVVRTIDSLAQTCRERRLQYRTRRVQNHIGRLFYTGEPDRENGTKTLKDLYDLAQIHTRTFVDKLRHGFPSLTTTEAPEIQLLKQHGTESNQVMLASKIYEPIRCGVEPASELAHKVIEVVLFLYERCGYKSLPGYFLAHFMKRKSSWNYLRELGPVWKLVQPVPSTLPEPLLELVSRKVCSPDVQIKLKALAPKHIRTYITDYGSLRNDFLHPAMLQHIRGRYDVIQFLFKIRIQFNLSDIASWSELTVAEFRIMASFVHGWGFYRFLPQAMARGQSDLVEEVFRHRPLVWWISRQPDWYLFLSCQVAIRFGCHPVLRGLLTMPSVADRMRSYDAKAQLENHPNSAASHNPCLRVLQSTFRPGLDPYPNDFDMNSHLVIDLEAFQKALDERHTTTDEYGLADVYDMKRYPVLA